MTSSIQEKLHCLVNDEDALDDDTDVVNEINDINEKVSVESGCRFMTSRRC